jgi:hypothetical protein
VLGRCVRAVARGARVGHAFRRRPGRGVPGAVVGEDAKPSETVLVAGRPAGGKFSELRRKPRDGSMFRSILVLSAEEVDGEARCTNLELAKWLTEPSVGQQHRQL